MSETRERKLEGLTVRIDRDRCIASANCVAIGGEIFEIDPGGIVTFRDDAEPIGRDALVEACRVCPVDALIVIDAGGRRLVPE